MGKMGLSLVNMCDVEVDTPTDQYLLYWDSAASKWKCKALSDSDIPAAIARDAEVASAIATHAALFGLHTRIIRKTADESVNNSNAMQNDDELLFAVAANEVWLVEIVLINKSATSGTPCMKCQLSLPSGAVFRGWVSGTDPSEENLFGWWNGGSKSFYADSVDYYLWFHAIGVLINGGTAGNMQLQWAQNTATAENTTLKANSCIIAHQMA